MTNALVKEGMKDLGNIAAWAEAAGFEDLEVGPTVPLEKALFEKVLCHGNVGLSSLTYCRNFLSADKEEAALHLAELKKRIEFAGDMGIEKIVTSTGIDKTPEEGVYDRADAIRRLPIRSLDKVVEVFLPVLEAAEKRGVKIAFENCPLMGNIAISPMLWRELFLRLDSSNAGLAYDPSHLLWEMIDPYLPVTEFASRIFHIHAKDTRIDCQRLGEVGILTDFSWWNYRIPGNGMLDWDRFIKELQGIGYTGTVSIEHEDADYEGTLEKVQQGLLMGKQFLEKKLTA